MAILALVPGLQAASVFTSVSFSPNVEVPDNDPAGLLDRRMVTSAIVSIETIQVSVFTTGGWNGDLIAYIAHDSGFAVLLNRIGRTLDNPDGFDSIGMGITFVDNALGGDVHTTPILPDWTTFLQGTYQPDGRTASPFTVTDLDPRSAFLSSFIGLPASGEWELFVADLSPGSTSRLVSWELELSGAIPEPGTAILLALAPALLLRRRRS